MVTKDPDVIDTTTIPGVTLYIWTTAGTGTWGIPVGVNRVKYLVIGAGAGGSAGGGGAGGMREGVLTTTPEEEITITVGDGGAGNSGLVDHGTNGSDSVLDTITATGGGGGGPAGGIDLYGANGGSGGGGGALGGGTTYGGDSDYLSPKQGYDGGGNSGFGGSLPTGGGGGAGAVGYSASSTTVAGSGGIGVSSTITGSTVWYAGGGGGGLYSSIGTAGSGGTGGGGAGAKESSNGTAGTSNTGGGGGAGGCNGGTGGKGGSGYIVLQYPNIENITCTINAVTNTVFGLSGPAHLNVVVSAISETNIYLSGPVPITEIVNTISTCAPDLTNILGFLSDVTLYPTAYISNQILLTDMETLIVSATVDRDLESKMFTATFEFDKNVISTISENYFSHVVFTIPDYLGVSNVVFCGFFPTSVSRYISSNAKDSFSAVDYAFYLTKQYLPDTLLSLQTPTFQATYQKYRLNYDFCTDPLLNFEVGQRVVGGTTGDSGKVFENQFSGYMGRGYLILCDVGGSLHLTEPFFHDDEDLNVNGVKFAAADGFTMNVTGTPIVIHPDDWVREVLGGDNWQKVTGIEPYRIKPVAAWDTGALPAVVFDFQTTQTKTSAIEEVAEYCSYIFLVKWRKVGDDYRPCAYFVDETLIDHATEGLDLPAAATIDYATDTTVIGIDLNNRGEEKYNKVTVRCMSMAGIWYESVKQSDAVAAGEERPIEFYEENKNLASQVDADARSLDIYNYYSSNVKTWTITLRARSDLQLLQKITFAGFDTMYQLPNAAYRIISISNTQSYDTNKTIIRVVADVDFTAHLKLNRTFTGTIATMQAVAKDELKKLAQIDVGTITAIDGSTITLMTERGITKIARDAY